MGVLTGKVAVITGASAPHGIGRAIANRFAAEGASLLLVADRTAEQLEDAVAECRSKAVENARLEQFSSISGMQAQQSG